MKHDLEKTTTHGRVTSCTYEFYYSSFTDVVSIEANWNNINEKERVAIPCEKLDELITFLQDARMMYNLGQNKQAQIDRAMLERNEQ